MTSDRATADPSGAASDPSGASSAPGDHDLRRGRLLALIFAITLVGITGNSLITPALPDILDEFEVGDSSAGIVIAATSLPGVFVAPIVGVLADRLGRRAVVVPCLVIFGLGGLSVAAAPTFPSLIAGRLVMGVGAAGLINLAVVLIGDHWEGTDRTRLIGRNSAILTVGLAVLPLVSGAITDLANWRAALLIYTGAFLVAAAAWAVLPRGRPQSHGTLREQLDGLGDVLRRPEIVAILAAGVLVFVLIFGVFLATLPIHLRDEFGANATTRGVFLGMPAVFSSIIAFNLDRVTGRFGVRRTTVVSAGLFAAAFALIGVSPVLALIAVGCAMYGLGEGALIPVLQDAAVTAAPEAHRGAVVAVWVSAARAGQTIGPLAAAGLYGVTSTSFALLVGAGVSLGLLAILAIAPIGRARDARSGARPA